MNNPATQHATWWKKQSAALPEEMRVARVGGHYSGEPVVSLAVPGPGFAAHPAPVHAAARAGHVLAASALLSLGAAARAGPGGLLYDGV